MLRKRIITVLLINVLILTAFSGCNSKKDNNLTMHGITTEVPTTENTTTETPTVEKATTEAPTTEEIATETTTTETPTTETPTTEIPTTQAPTTPPDTAPTIDEQVEAIINDMTLHEKVCQLFVVAPEKLMNSGTVTVAGAEVKAKLKEYPVAGFIFFASNLVEPEQTKTMLSNLQTYSNEIIGLEFYTCIDEEGGRVARIGNNPAFGVTKINAMSTIKTIDEAYNAGNTIGRYLSNLGFNFDFAPDADVLTNPLNTVINDRSFGNDADIVSDFSVSYAKGLQANNVLSTFKHFPGHGSTEGDTHEGYAYTSKNLEELMAAELKPFKAAAENNVDAIMAAHISVPTVLGDNTPCTLSKYMITDVLRNELGYEGLVITDALGMGAIANEYSSDEAAVKAILAGNDLLLMPEDFYQAYNGVMDAVSEGIISEDRIDESLRRIIKSKILLNN